MNADKLKALRLAPSLRECPQRSKAQNQIKAQALNFHGLRRPELSAKIGFLQNLPRL